MGLQWVLVLAIIKKERNWSCFGTVLPQYFLYWKLRFLRFYGSLVIVVRVSRVITRQNIFSTGSYCFYGFGLSLSLYGFLMSSQAGIYGFMGFSCYHPLEFAHFLQEDAWKAWKRLKFACELVKVCNNKMENLLKIFRRIKSISNQYVLINLLCTYAVWGLKKHPAVRCLFYVFIQESCFLTHSFRLWCLKVLQCCQFWKSFGKVYLDCDTLPWI